MGTGGPTQSYSDDPSSARDDHAEEGAPLPGEEHRTLRETALEALLPRAGRVVAGKYRVDELMARGGMGAVYAATHQVTGKRVAIKWMLPQLDQVPAATERFVREAQATARINHPNVVDIYDVGQEGTSFYLVMELLRGETLRARMRHGPLSSHDAIALLMPAMRGVAAAHTHRVVHRDLKPDNIFLCEGPDGEQREAKVLDFGISKFSSDHGRDAALTQSGTVLGTPYYMAPEQVRGLKDIDGRADVYAFGVILYELLSGRRPFEADSYNGLILQIATERPVPLHLVHAEVPEALSDVIHRALARAPEDRYQTIEELASALLPFTQGVSFRMSQSLPSGLHSMRTPISSQLAPQVIGLGASHSGVPGVAPARPGPHSARAHRVRVRVLVGSLVALCVLGAAVWLQRAPNTASPEARPVAPASAAAVAEPSVPAASANSAVDSQTTTQPASAIAPAPAALRDAIGAEPGALGIAPPAAHPIEATQSASPAAHTGRRRVSVRPGSSGTPRGVELPSSTVPSADALPDDWDMRLRPATPAGAAQRHPAGSLGEADFR